MLTVAITGPSGLIGTRVIELLSNSFSFLPIRHAECDITDKISVEKFLKDKEYDVLLHLAAYTKVDDAEKEPDLAYKMNVEGTRNLCRITEVQGKKLIYISTDFVFDGTKHEYTEESAPNPLGVYGKTKYQGELEVKNGVIARIAYPYRAQFEKKKDFVRSLLFALKNNKSLAMIDDITITPTYIDDLAFALKYLIENPVSGIYHLTGATSLSPFQAAQEIAEVFNLNRSLISKTTYNTFYKGSTYRPKHLVIKSKKNTFYTMKTLQEGLESMKEILYHVTL